MNASLTSLSSLNTELSNEQLHDVDGGYAVAVALVVVICVAVFTVRQMAEDQ